MEDATATVEEVLFREVVTGGTKLIVIATRIEKNNGSYQCRMNTESILIGWSFSRALNWRLKQWSNKFKLQMDMKYYNSIHALATVTQR